MNGSDFLTGPVAQAIGWALLHLLWQGAVLAAILAATLSLLSRRSANLRYIVSCAALVLLLVIGVGTAYRAYEPRPQELELRASPGYVFSMDISQPAPPTWRERAAPLTAAARASLPDIVLVWFVGVALLSARLMVMWLRAHRLARRDTQAAAAPWNVAAARLASALGLRRAVTLLQSATVEVPTVVGWMRPVILLPASALSGLSTEQIEMILAHELAHIRRHDFFVNLMQAVVETLLFYHPAVWWMSRRVRIERENCCDDLAVAVCGNALQYARALTRLEELRAVPSQPALAANGGSLLMRIRRLVGSRAESTSITSRWAAALGALTVLAMIVAIPSMPLMAQKQDAPKAEVPTTKAPVAETQDDDDSNVVDIDDVEPVVVPRIVVTPKFKFRPGMTPPPMPAAAPMPAVAPMPPRPPHAPLIARAARAAVAEVMGDYSDSDIDVDDDDELKKFGTSGRLTIDELIALRNQGVTPEYVEQMRAAGIGELGLGEILSLRIQGVSPNYIRDLRDAGVAVTSARDVIALRIHGVTGEFVRSLAAAGYTNLTARDLARLASNGINADFIREMSKYRDKQDKSDKPNKK